MSHSKTNMKAYVMAGLVLGVAWTVRSADWTQYRGPNHDGSSSEKIAVSWPADGPRRLWKTPLPDGFSSITTGDGKAFTLVDRIVGGAKQEVCVALDAATGKELWAVPLGI